MNEIFNENCFEGMKRIPDGSIDAIITDPPYSILSIGWDKPIDIPKMFDEFLRICKRNAAIAIFANNQFLAKLLRQCPEGLFKYKWSWTKNNVTNFIQARRRPMTSHEDILIFSRGNAANGASNLMTYNPQGAHSIPRKNWGNKSGTVIHKHPDSYEFFTDMTGFPRDTLHFKTVSKKLHTSEKPLDLIEFLVKTYSNEGEVVLDPFIGSGTTAIACIKTNRNYLGFEVEKKFFDIANKRIENI